MTIAPPIAVLAPGGTAAAASESVTNRAWFMLRGSPPRNRMGASYHIPEEASPPRCGTIGASSSRAAPPQVRFLDLRIVQQFRGGTFVDDLPGLQDIGVMGHLEGLPHVLLHQQDGRPLPVDLPDDPEDVGDDERRQPERRLVEKQKGWLRQKSPPHGGHLLFPPGEGAPCQVPPLLEEREPLHRRLDVLPHATVPPLVG